MATAVEQGARQPWYTRWQTLVLGMGALAGAILTVLGLWDRLFPADVPDPEDFGAITSVAITRQVTLNHYAKTIGRSNASLTPEPSAMRPGDWPNSFRIVPALVETPSPSASESVTPSQPKSPSSSTPTSTGSETATVTLTPDDSPTPDPAETETLAPYSVLSEEPLDEYTIAAEVLGLKVLGNKFGLSAKQIARALGAVESRPTRNKKKKSVKGYLVAVNIEVSGLKDVPLVLKWSLDGINVPVSWKADKQLHYQLSATTDHDSGSVNLWVPDLRKPGTYYVNVELVGASDGSIIAQGEPEKVPEFLKAQTRR